MGFKGAIRGIGTALTYAGQQGMEEQRQSRRDAVINEREIALAKLRAQLGEQAADADLGRKKELRTVETNERIRETAGELRAAAPYKREEAQTQLAIAEAKAEADFRRDIAKLEKQHGLRLTEAQYESGLQQARDAAARGERVVAEGVDADGNITVVYANNRVTRMEGLRPKPSGSDDDAPIAGRGGRPILTRRPAGKPAAPSTQRAEAWKTHIPVARQLLGQGATTEQVNAKAKELAAKYSGG